MISCKDYLQVDARAVEDQVAENPDLGIPVDPDVAEYMWGDVGINRNA